MVQQEMFACTTDTKVQYGIREMQVSEIIRAARQNLTRQVIEIKFMRNVNIIYSIAYLAAIVTSAIEVS